MISQENVAKLLQLDSQESQFVEPGLLPMFRLFVSIQLLLLSSLFIVISFAPLDFSVRALILWSLIWLVLLMGYLVWPNLPRQLGKYYLPIALIAASVFPVINQAVAFYFFLDLQASPNAAAFLSDSSWRLLIVLLVTLVFIAWQYDLRQVVRFSIGVPLLNVLLSGWMVRGSEIPLASFVLLNVNGALLFLLIGYIITNLRKAQREKQQALVAANAKLVDYAATAEQLAVSRERNRLARDMHDTLAHTLSAVSVQLEAADSVWQSSPDEAHRLMQESLASARNGLGETRRALRALRSSPLEDLGLALALRDLAESTADRAGWQLDLQLADDLSLPPDLEQNIYLIAQEALTNAARYANAHHVRLALSKESDLIEMTISDDGKGFDQQKVAPEGHFGLQGMAERAAQIGASLEVTSRTESSGVDHGTTVRLALKRTAGGTQ